MRNIIGEVLNTCLTLRSVVNLLQFFGQFLYIFYNEKLKISNLLL
jgi:hypothetical protein